MQARSSYCRAGQPGGISAGGRTSRQPNLFSATFLCRKGSPTWILDGKVCLADEGIKISIEFRRKEGEHILSVKVDSEVTDMITPDDHNALHEIYRHRCLNETQLTKYVYYARDDGYNGYALRRIKGLVSFGLLDVHEYGANQKCVFFLTYRGVQYVRDTAGRPLYRVKERSGRKRYETSPSGLWLPDSMLDHQTRLNDLALDLIWRCHLDPDCYKDNLFASNFT